MTSDRPRFISSDSHVIEPPDLWTSRVSKRFLDRAPRVVAEEDGDWWFVDGCRTNSFQGGAQAGKRFDRHEELRPAARFSDVRPAAYDPEEFVRENESDSVYGSVVYPTEGLQLFSVPDDALLTEIFRVYNDWIAEFCGAHRNRLKGVALINAQDVGEATKELERVRKLGLEGAMISVYPSEENSYDRPEYADFWAAAQSLGLPLGLHISTNRPSRGAVLEDNRSIRASKMANADYWVRMSLGSMILSGVFEKFPSLRVGAVEHELGWAPHFLERIDYTYTQRTRRKGWHRYKDGALPSDFFRRNVFLSFQEDKFGIQNRHIIGIENMMWGSDYPHTETTFPRSKEILDDLLSDVPDIERQKITTENVARLYNFDLASAA